MWSCLSAKEGDTRVCACEKEKGGKGKGKSRRRRRSAIWKIEGDRRPYHGHETQL